MNCDFSQQHGNRMVCQACGRSLPIIDPSLGAESYLAHCKATDAGSVPHFGSAKSPDYPLPVKLQRRLGDWTETLLRSMGVTEDRYKAVKEKFGLAPTCGCKARREWLNWVSDWLVS